MECKQIMLILNGPQQSGLAQSQLKECNKPVFHYLMTHIQTVWVSELQNLRLVTLS